MPLEQNGRVCDMNRRPNKSARLCENSQTRKNFAHIFDMTRFYEMSRWMTVYGNSNILIAGYARFRRLCLSSGRCRQYQSQGYTKRPMAVSIQ